jgi:hypothetical protein
MIGEPFYRAKYKNNIVSKLAKQFKCDAVIMHRDRGCEGTAQYQMKIIALQKMGMLVVTFGGNMADKMEFDEGCAQRIIVSSSPRHWALKNDRLVGISQKRRQR